MSLSLQRQKVHFISAGTECVAWHYPGTNGACVIMAGGFAVTKEPATDVFAARFQAAGFAVLAFDYRGVGESAGEPRLVLPIKKQIADWHAAIAHAATLADVDPAKIALWGFSASGGHILRAAADNPTVAAVIAQAPLADGPVGLRNASEHQTTSAMLRFTWRAILDALGSLVGRRPLLVPLIDRPGTVAMLTTPDGLDGPPTLNPGNRYPDWEQRVAARSALLLGFYRPGRDASRIHVPLLVVVCDQDQTAPPGPAVRAANSAPHGEVVHLAGGHYEPFLGGHERTVEAEVSFLNRHLLGRRAADRPAPADTAR
ncbi:alpha/beta hydrolase [Pseudonocardia spinosispora]|uniref:alpha/beta hydrolase n=1 Tax=Pseudonocardia spinosispora TaxID=103441 RepID=UPI0006840F8D|nr:alpha/beta hydrolase [Pseudonocardia spinosispora]